MWSLQRLRDALPPGAFDKMYAKLAASAALAVTAALPDIRAEAAALGTLPNSSFELLGLDFLLDEAMHPWLLEVRCAQMISQFNRQWCMPLL